MRNTLNWFEIPALDMDRAVRFYQEIFQVALTTGPAGGEGYLMSMFPDGGGVGGALVSGEGYVPSASGTLVYLNCNPSLDTVLGRVEAAGGQIIVPKTDIGENGFFAFVIDSEGNRVGLHESARQ
jgi:predicted enzyme related to lactoylglutathione lyase